MPHVSTPPPGDRFFAQVDRFTCECPSCGRLIHAQLDYRRGGRGKEARRRRPRRAEERTYNPYTQRLACPGCHKTYQVGLLLYPVVERSWRALAPSDTVPTPRQQLAIRRHALGGLWTEEPKRSGEAVNLVVEAKCSCPQPYGWAAACPLHGWIPRGEGGESPESV